MIKFLLIAVLVIYSFYRVASFLFRFVFGGFAKNQFNSTQYKSRKAPNSNLHVDQVPRSQSERKGDFQGGDYVDFEEVK